MKPFTERSRWKRCLKFQTLIKYLNEFWKEFELIIWFFIFNNGFWCFFKRKIYFQIYKDFFYFIFSCLFFPSMTSFFYFFHLIRFWKQLKFKQFQLLMMLEKFWELLMSQTFCYSLSESFQRKSKDLIHSQNHKLKILKRTKRKEKKRKKWMKFMCLFCFVDFWNSLRIL